MSSRTRGQIKSESKVLLDDIEIWIQEHKPELGLKSWGGTFHISPSLPGQQQADFLNGSREMCQLILQDGRSGEIIIRNTQITSSGISVIFYGSGPLAKS